MPTILNIIRISATQIKLVVSKLLDGQQYTLRYSNLMDLSGNSISGSEKFIASASVPRVLSAMANNATSIRVIFDMSMSDIGLTTNGNYTFTCPAGAIITVGSIVKINSTTVDIVISGEMRTGADNYTITVSNVIDSAGNGINPMHNSAQFNGVGIAPQLSAATQSGSTHINLTFDESMTTAPVEDPANYAITGDDTPAVTSAAQTAADTARLTVPFVSSGNYTVTASNLTDIVGNTIDPAHNSINFSVTLGPFDSHPTLSTDILAYWKLDSNANDSVGARNGTLENAPLNVACKINNGYQFDGTNQDIKIPHDAGLNLSTFSFWVNPAELNRFQIPFSKGGYSDPPGPPEQMNYRVILGSVSNRWSFDLNTSDGSFACESDNTAVIGRWDHIVGTFDGSDMIIYHNGTLKHTTPVTGIIQFTNYDLFFARRGGNTASCFLNGKLDEIGLWTRALTGSEVTDLYNGGSGLTY